MKYSIRYWFFLRTFIVGVSVVFLPVVFLSGCAFAPGMRFDGYNTKVKSIANASAVSPIIKTISPQLIQQEQQLALAATGIHRDIVELITPPQPYKIGAGDYLAITVWDHPELSMPGNSMTPPVTAVSGSLPAGYSVSSEGKIQFPYAGGFSVAGLTELQARDLLVQRLASYIKKPEVTLRVMSYRSQRVYVDGEVKLSGIVQIDDIPLSLPEALSRAGGIAALGDQSRITITRNKKTI